MIRIARFRICQFSACPKDSETLFGFQKSQRLSLSGASLARNIPFWTGSDRNDQDRTGLYLEFLGMPQGFRNTFRISKKSTFKPLWRSLAVSGKEYSISDRNGQE